jgi:Flp pilus assembly pilin Flp
MRIKVIRIKEKIKSLCERKGQSTLEYALVMVIAGIISAILVAVGKPMIIDIISKVFSKISQMV